MKDKKVTVISTVYNEAATIVPLLNALSRQTVRPEEVIICDADSNDDTQILITDFAATHPHVPLTLIVQKGNRSGGRNVAITRARTDLIAITDAGCIPKQNWLEELLVEYERSKAPVIAGYYQGLVTNAFEEAEIPYVLVMPNRVDPTAFLPATRSMLLTKEAWKAAGTFNEHLDINEDYLFARTLKKVHIPISFAQKAVVSWMPRKNLLDFFRMIYNYAEGDIRAGVLRPKVGLIFMRYIVVTVFLIIAIWHWSFTSALWVSLVFLMIYCLWAIQKNKQYVRKGWWWLPILQLTSDVAVMVGSLHGVLRTKPSQNQLKQD